MPPIRKRRKVWVKHDLIGCLLPNSHMCSLTPPANTISPLPDSPPLYLYTLSTLGATGRANQPSNDACFPTIQTTKKAIQGVGGFSASCSARVGRGAQSHHICPPSSLHLPGNPFQLPSAGLYAKAPLHQPFTPVSHQFPKNILSKISSVALTNSSIHLLATQ